MQRERIPVRLFVIAAAKDAAYQVELEKHLYPLWEQGLLANWQSVQAGEKVEEAFAKAKLIVFLLSVDFSTDASCQEWMKRALQRERQKEVKVLPILLRSVDVTKAPFLHLPMAPTNGQAVTMWENQDEAWTHIMQVTRGLLEGKSLPQAGAVKLVQVQLYVPIRPRQQERSRRWRSWTILVGISVLVVVGGVFLLRSQNIPTLPHPSNSPATQTVAVLQNVSVFHEEPQSSYSGVSTLLDDSLADNKAGYNWQQSSDTFGGCRFSEKAYHVHEEDTRYYYDCVAFHTNFSDFFYEVNMRIVRGDCGGLLFRMEGSLNSYYHFVVCQNGKAMLARCDERAKPCISILPFQSYSAINEGENSINLIAVRAQGSLISIYANNQYLNLITDDKHKQGQIGLEADPSDNQTTEVIYSNALVETIPDA